MDNTLVVWPYGQEALGESITYLNTLYEGVKFTVELEQQGSLPFLDLLIIRWPDGTLACSVYRKPIHTGLYLNSYSHHHPAQKWGVLLTFIYIAHGVADSEHLHNELMQLRHTFQQNGYTKAKIKQAFNNYGRVKPKPKEEDIISGVAVVPFCSTVTNRLSRMLQQ